MLFAPPETVAANAVIISTRMGWPATGELGRVAVLPAFGDHLAHSLLPTVKLSAPWLTTVKGVTVDTGRLEMRMHSHQLFTESQVYS